MEFIQSGNLPKIMRQMTSSSMSQSITDITGASRAFNSSYSVNFVYGVTLNTTWTAATTALPYVYASSKSDVSPSDYTIPNIVGTASVSSTKRSDNRGYLLTVTITSSSDADINSLFVTKKFTAGGGSTQSEAVIYILKLGSTVHLNASNGRTATFTIDIIFPDAT